MPLTGGYLAHRKSKATVSVTLGWLVPPCMVASPTARTLLPLLACSAPPSSPGILRCWWLPTSSSYVPLTNTLRPRHPHYPAKPLIPLKICSLNKHLQHGAGAPLVQLLQEFNFLLSRFYNELCTVATSRGLPSVQSLRSLGSRARARMDSAIQRRQTLSQVLQPGHITVMLG